MQRDIVKKTKDELGRNAKNILKIQKTTGREKQRKTEKDKRKQMITWQI